MYSKFCTALLQPILTILLLLPNTNARAEGTILVFGDSISAAYGMDPAKGWVNLLAQRLSRSEFRYRVVNASVSGETTGGGLIRLPKTLGVHQPDLVVLELGGNDGLRGYPIDKIQSNLMEMTRLVQQSDAQVLIIGMVLPPNYGRRYTNAFESLFSAVASERDVPLLPFLLDGAATPEELIQRDGIHPRPEAQPLLVEEIWPLVEELLGAQYRTAPLESGYSVTPK